MRWRYFDRIGIAWITSSDRSRRLIATTSSRSPLRSRSQIEPEIILEIVDCHGVSHGVLDVLDTHTVFQCRSVDVHLGYRTTKLSVREARFWEGKNTGNPDPTCRTRRPREGDTSKAKQRPARKKKTRPTRCHPYTTSLDVTSRPHRPTGAGGTNPPAITSR